MKYLLVYIITFTTLTSWAQDLTPKVQEIVDGIAESNSVTSEFIYYGGEKSKQFERFQTLDSLALTDELKFLLSHKSPVVRCAAFTSLCKRDIIEALKYLRPALYDKETVNTQNGCIGSSSKIGDIFIEQFIYSLAGIDSTEWMKIQPELLKLDSIIVYDPEIKLLYKSARIKGLEPDSSHYKLIREMAYSKSEPYAVIKLAKYKIEKDKQIIIEWLEDEENKYYGIWAVREFPDSTFYPYLLKIFEKEWQDRYYSYSTWRILYQALAQYPNEPETIRLFDKTISAGNKFRRETLSRYLLIAAIKYPNSKYEKYKNKINVTGLHEEFLEEEMNIEN